MRPRGQAAAAAAALPRCRACPTRIPAGLSAAAAQAVTARYPTPAGLLRQVELFGRTDVAAQLAALPCPRGGRQPPLAADQALALLHQLFPCENVRQVEQAQRQQAQRQQAQRKQPHALQQPQPGSAVATAAGGTPAVPRFKGPKRSARAPAAFMPADRTEAAAGHHEIIDLTED